MAVPSTGVMTAKELSYAINMARLGNNDECARVLLAIVENRTPVLAAAAGNAIADLTGTLTGTPDGALADLTTLTDSPADADALRDQLMSAWKVEIDSHFEELQVKINGILAALRTAGVIASS